MARDERAGIPPQREYQVENEAEGETYRETAPFESDATIILRAWLDGFGGTADYMAIRRIVKKYEAENEHDRGA